MEIRKYNKQTDEVQILKIIAAEDGWEYADESNVEKYKKALESCITWVAYDEEKVCGYSRSMNDNDFHIFVLDILVAPAFRGRGIGRMLMECLNAEFPGLEIFVLSDVDVYYEKLGYKNEGSIFEVSI